MANSGWTTEPKLREEKADSADEMLIADEMHLSDGVGRAPRLQKRPGTTRHVVAPPSHSICLRSPDLDKGDTTGDIFPADRPQIGVQEREEARRRLHRPNEAD